MGARLEAFVELYCADSIAPVDLIAAVRDLAAIVGAHTVAGDADAIVPRPRGQHRVARTGRSALRRDHT